MRAVSRSQNRPVTGLTCGLTSTRGCAHNGCSGGKRLGGEHVERGAPQGAAVEALDQCLDVQERAARHVDDHGPGGKPLQHLASYRAVGLGRARRGDHQHVALGGETQQIRAASHPGHTRRSAPLGPAPDPRDAHPEGQRPPRHGAADAAEADDPHAAGWRAPARESCGRRTHPGSSAAPPGRAQCDRSLSRSRRSRPAPSRRSARRARRRSW